MKATINGIDLAYDDQGVGLPVVFLHAFPLNRNMWEGQVLALLNEQQFRPITLDWRGLGESDIVATVSTMEVFADDVAGLLDMLGLPRAVLCGLSMGGYAAFAFLRKYPQRVSGLILADTKPEADSEEAKANREHVAQLAESQGVGAIADLQVPRLLGEYTRRHNPEVERRVRQMIEAATPQGIAAASRGMAQRIDSTDLLSAIACPTLVVVGEQDGLTPPALAQAYAARIAAAQFTVIPQAGHLTNLEQPELFFATILAFLRGLS